MTTDTHYVLRSKKLEQIKVNEGEDTSKYVFADVTNNLLTVWMNNVTSRYSSTEHFTSVYVHITDDAEGQ